jgi:hypothetical protein
MTDQMMTTATSLTTLVLAASLGHHPDFNKASV